MLGAVVFGHEQGNIAIAAINELVRDAGKPEWDWKAPAKDEAFIAKVNALAEEPLRAAYQIRSKQARTQACREAYANVLAALKAEGAEFDAVKVEALLFDIEARIVRSQILAGEPRIDGRDTRTVRPIEIRNGVLPRTHGSALFTRGETQALVVATLGTERDAQRIDALAGEFSDRFMLHYNMPPFATGETGRVGSPKRREIGHGRLAKRALLAALPKQGRLPVHDARGLRDHRIERLVVDGLGLRRLPGADGRRRADEGARGRHRDGPDQGRQPLRRADRHPGRRGPPRRHGLQGGRHHQRHHRAADGHQDPGHHQGDHAGRAGAGQGSAPAHPGQDAGGDGRGQGRGVAVRAAPVHDEDQPGEDPRRDRQGRRRHPRADRRDRLRRSTSAKTAPSPSPRPTPTRPSSPRSASSEITAEVEVGKVYEGPITKILDFGALVNLLPGKDGLLHISQIAHQRVEKVTDFLKEGQIVKVKVLETDEKGRVKLSMKALLERPEGMEEERERPPRREYGDRPRRDRDDRGDRGDRRARAAPKRRAGHGDADEPPRD